MKYDAAVRIHIDATSKEEAIARIERAIAWLGFGCEVVHVVAASRGEEMR